MIDKKNKSGFYLLSDNTDAFVARFALATMAKRTLDIQYYIMHRDASGQYLAYALLAAADRGVRVRILVDDINLSGRDSSLKMMAQHDNIEIRIFNPLKNREWFRNIELIINLDRAGRRMHNKSFIADNAAAIIGGRNIGDEYFDARQSMNFVDLDLLTVGPVVGDITRSFNDFWYSAWSTPVEQLSNTKVVKQKLKNVRRKLKDRWNRAKNTHYFESVRQSELTQRILRAEISFIWAHARFFYDHPEKIVSTGRENIIHFGPEVMPYFERVDKSLSIASPYFVPGNDGLDWLLKKHQQGVDIEILTNSLAATDVIAVHAGYKKYRKQLVAAGIRLFELKPTAKNLRDRTRLKLTGSSNSSLHAKYMVLDRRYVFVGSANIDPRSSNLNTEIGILVDNEELAAQTLRLFRRTTSLENSYQVKTDHTGSRLTWLTEEDGNERISHHEPHASLLRRTGVFLISLLPIESLL